MVRIIDSGPHHVDWITSEAAAEGLTVLLATLCSDTQPLVEDLLSLMIHNAIYRRERVDWSEEYEMLPIHFLLRLKIDLNTWCISVEEEAG